jgi:RNA polymerase sigma factor (sigma-70 family)
LFQRYNYCRYRIMKILRAHAGKRLSASATRELLRWDQVALDVRDEIVQANLGLVPSMVERSRLTGVDFAELISEGQLALLRSVDKFDCTRGFKFSTYACRAILTSISRAVALMARHRAQFPAEYDPDLQKNDSIEVRREDTEATCIRELANILRENSAELTATERRVLSERFGVRGGRKKGGADPKTLRQVAEIFGVTKERVRQIQNKALAKLRTVLDGQAFAA